MSQPVRPRDVMGNMPVLPSACVNNVANIMARIRRDIVMLAEHGATETANAMLMWLDSDPAISFEAALRLPKNWRCQARLRNRDALLLDLARRRFTDSRGSQLARAVSCAGRRYAGSTWPRDRRAGRRPDGLNGDLFDILSHGDIPGVDRLLQIFKELGQ